MNGVKAAAALKGELPAVRLKHCRTPNLLAEDSAMTARSSHAVATRRFIFFVALLVIAAVAPEIWIHAMSADRPAVEIGVVKQVPSQARTSLYTSNREPLLPSPLVKLPIGSIVPRGWLRGQLELEAQGMTGRLMEISPWCRFEKNAWTDPEGKGHSGWEELPYWLKGYADLGYVLKDEAIIKEARRWIEAALASQRDDGWFGPRSLLTSLDGKPDLWPNMLMLNVLQSFYEYSGDPRVLPFMAKYFRWELNYPEQGFHGRLLAEDSRAATTWRPSTGSTIARARSGCSSWPRRSTAARRIGPAA